MKSKLKKINKKTEEMFKASSVAVLLENVNHNIQIIAEGQDGLRDKMHKEIGNLRSEMKEEIGGLRSEMKEGFNLMMDYWEKIDKEIVAIKKELGRLKKKKVNLDSYFLLEKRVQKAENKIAEIIELNKKLVKKRRKVKI